MYQSIRVIAYCNEIPVHIIPYVHVYTNFEDAISNLGHILLPQMLHIEFHNATRLLVFLIIIFYTTQVSMKHSGSLFLYSGDNGGAFAKNSYGNL